MYIRGNHVYLSPFMKVWTFAFPHNGMEVTVPIDDKIVALNFKTIQCELF